MLQLYTATIIISLIIFICVNIIEVAVFKTKFNAMMILDAISYLSFVSIIPVFNLFFAQKLLHLCIDRISE